MSLEHQEVRELGIQLPPTAPQVRITAGMGSASQKTWNVRRPVTLIGAKRPAHIVLHDPAISNAHCVVINTGSEILLKDLHTSGGTLLNGNRVDISVLKDGDLIVLGEVQIQIAIQAGEGGPDDSGCGMRYDDPTRYAEPITVQLAFTDMCWHIESAAALVGRHEAAAVRLDHADLCSRHAVIFRFQDGPAIFDISDKIGLKVNDQVCSLTPLRHQDRVTVGPFTLVVSSQSAEDLAAQVAEPLVAATPADGSYSEPSTLPGATLTGLPSKDEQTPEAEPSIEELTSKLLTSWDEMNTSALQAAVVNPAVEKKLEDLEAREAELDARDAALRGKLHDITRYHELVLARERDLGAMAARMQAESDELNASKKAFQQQCEQHEQRSRELQRKEGALAQRWSRMQSLTCPNCGSPVAIGNVEEAK